jgi:hypothetical protein
MFSSPSSNIGDRSEAKDPNGLKGQLSMSVSHISDTIFDDSQIYKATIARVFSSHCRRCIQPD